MNKLEKTELKLHVKVDDFNVFPNRMMVLKLNVDEFYMMLDDLDASIITDYINRRITDARIIRRGNVEECIVKARALDEWITKKKASGEWNPEDEIIDYND